jgi:hypothetical protein
VWKLLWQPTATGSRPVHPCAQLEPPWLSYVACLTLHHATVTHMLYLMLKPAVCVLCSFNPTVCGPQLLVQTAVMFACDLICPTY